MILMIIVVLLILLYNACVVSSLSASGNYGTDITVECTSSQQTIAISSAQLSGTYYDPSTSQTTTCEFDVKARVIQICGTNTKTSCPFKVSVEALQQSDACGGGISVNMQLYVNFDCNSSGPPPTPPALPVPVPEPAPASLSVDVAYGNECPVVCTSTQRITITMAMLKGSYFDYAINQNTNCEWDVTYRVQAICGTNINPVCYFDTDIDNLERSNACGGGESADMRLWVNFQCNNAPTGPPPAPPPCGEGQDYPSCNSCGNILLFNHIYT